MVAGLKKFAEHFAGYDDRYVLIGGTALWLAMDDAGLQARARQVGKRWHPPIAQVAARAEGHVQTPP